MTRIRRIEIDHFRSISHLDWYPEPGINCLIGPGDSGKSTILDAIDLCLGARRQAQFTDSDFHSGDFSTPICISMTIGDEVSLLTDFHRCMHPHERTIQGVWSAITETWCRQYVVAEGIGSRRCSDFGASHIGCPKSLCCHDSWLEVIDDMFFNAHFECERWLSGH